MSLKTMIVCDECGKVGEEGVREKAWLMRNTLSLLGWRCGLQGGLDMCPDCCGDAYLPDCPTCGKPRAECVCLQASKGGEG